MIRQMFKEFLKTRSWLKIMLPCQDWFHWSETTSQQTLSQAFLVYQIHSGRGTQCQILLTNLLFWHGEAVVHICHINPIICIYAKNFPFTAFHIFTLQDYDYLQKTGKEWLSSAIIINEWWMRCENVVWMAKKKGCRR